MDVQAQALTETFPWRSPPNAQFAVIAEDATHSLSPRMHRAGFDNAGLPHLRYVAVDVRRGEVAEALEALKRAGYVGVNVTVPHKAEARKWVQELEPTIYPEINVVNTVRFRDLVGANTDTIGFRQSIDRFDLQRGDTALVLGAGGSAEAVVAVLAKKGVRVIIWNRTVARAESLARRFENVFVSSSPSPAGCRIIVNATSAGKVGEEPAVEWRLAESGAIAYDLYYAKGSTPFLRSATARGLVCQDGVALLVLQGAAAWKVWELPSPAPIEIMEKAVRDALGS